MIQASSGSRPRSSREVRKVVPRRAAWFGTLRLGRRESLFVRFFFGIGPIVSCPRTPRRIGGGGRQASRRWLPPAPAAHATSLRSGSWPHTREVCGPPSFLGRSTHLIVGVTGAVAAPRPNPGRIHVRCVAHPRSSGGPHTSWSG